MTQAQAYKGPPAGSGHTDDDVKQRKATVPAAVPDPRTPGPGIFSAQDTVLPSKAGPKVLSPSGLP